MNRASLLATVVTRCAVVRTRMSHASVARGAVHAFLILAASAGLGYLVQTLLARVMTVHEYGSYTYANHWAEILAYPAGLGLHAAALKFVPSYQANQNPSALRGFVRSALLATLATGSALALATLLWAWTHAGPAFHIWVYAALLIPVHALVALYMQMSRAQGRIIAALAPPMVLRHLGVALGCALILWGGYSRSAGAFMLALTLTMVAVLAAVGGVFHADLRRRHPGREMKTEWEPWLRLSIPLLFSTLFMVLLGRVDLIALGAYRGAEEVALYNAALKTALLTNFVLLAIATAVTPKLALHRARNDHPALQKLLATSSLAAFIPSLFICAGLWLLGPWILSWFGDPYVAAYPALKVLVLGHLAAASVGLAGTILNLSGQAVRATAIYGTAVALDIMLCLLWIPKYGAVGAAWATVLAATLCNLVLVVEARRHLKLNPSIFTRAWLHLRP